MIYCASGRLIEAGAVGRLARHRGSGPDARRDRRRPQGSAPRPRPRPPRPRPCRRRPRVIVDRVDRSAPRSPAPAPPSTATARSCATPTSSASPISARPSRDPRFYLLDTASGRVTRHLVAHGRGSDPAHTGFLQRFSNRSARKPARTAPMSPATIITGKYGRSMRLRGLDWSNSNAEARAIVVHSAWYAEPAASPPTRQARPQRRLLRPPLQQPPGSPRPPRPRPLPLRRQARLGASPKRSQALSNDRRRRRSRLEPQRLHPSVEQLEQDHHLRMGLVGLRAGKRDHRQPGTEPAARLGLERVRAGSRPASRAGQPPRPMPTICWRYCRDRIARAPAVRGAGLSSPPGVPRSLQGRRRGRRRSSHPGQPSGPFRGSWSRSSCRGPVATQALVICPSSTSCSRTGQRSD